MNKLPTIMLAIPLLFALLISCDEEPTPATGPKAVTKTNTMKVYMHYMPWFQSKEVSGYWGSHWRMANKNPDNIDANGKREIASHYYPLIGPYDSKDARVAEYHLLLMKYAGIDGVLIDWYGSHNVNDYQVNLIGANALINRVDDAGLQFAIVYEDFTAGVVEDKTTKTAMQAAMADMDYIKKNYSSQSSYLRIDGAPLILTFGPRYFKQGSQWSEVFSMLGETPAFLPLWNHASLTGDTDKGEFSWVDFTPTYSDLTSFYNKAPHLPVLIGSAYPRFHDYYVEGGVGQSYGYVADDDGQTLIETMALAKQRNLKHLQLVTWNDFGEGTVIEPTAEYGFESLVRIQEFTGVPYGIEELQLIHAFYLKRKENPDDAEVLQKLENVFELLAALEVDKAKELLESIE